MVWFFVNRWHRGESYSSAVFKSTQSDRLQHLISRASITEQGAVRGWGQGFLCVWLMHGQRSLRAHFLDNVRDKII